jgi:hypothetical protein
MFASSRRLASAAFTAQSGQRFLEELMAAPQSAHWPWGPRFGLARLLNVAAHDREQNFGLPGCWPHCGQRVTGESGAVGMESLRVSDGCDALVQDDDLADRFIEVEDVAHSSPRKAR